MEDLIPPEWFASQAQAWLLVTRITSVVKDSAELTVGNVIGADVLNVLFVVGASAAPAIFLWLHLPVMLLVLALYIAYADAYLTVALEPDGTVGQARMGAVSPETDFSFDFQDLLLIPKSPPGKWARQGPPVTNRAVMQCRGVLQLWLRPACPGGGRP